MDFDQVCSSIIAILDQGINMVGFVSPSHFIPQMLSIINGLNASGHHPTWVYNSNGYDKPETLRMLEGIIDIYLPDLKYLDNQLSFTLSDAADYPEYAKMALREMFRQKGTTLVLNDDGTASSGMIIRHLVLPGQVENTLEVLRFIAGELSPRVHVSLMSQYYPTPGVVSHSFLRRSITADEYTKVIDEMELLGLQKGWVQEFESMNHYRPDFTNEHPFENS
jgi:putative pyruvate formate lyase activating enzyme